MNFIILARDRQSLGAYPVRPVPGSGKGYVILAVPPARIRADGGCLGGGQAWMNGLRGMMSKQVCGQSSRVRRPGLQVGVSRPRPARAGNSERDFADQKGIGDRWPGRRGSLRI